MKLEVRRMFLRESYTIGKLYVNGRYFCDTLEDKARRVKVPGKTAIPYGDYEVRLTFSPHFKRPLPILLNVRGFDGIRIHSGNGENDTSGCILVGENKIKGRLINSRKTEERLVEEIRQAVNRGEKIKLSIV